MIIVENILLLMLLKSRRGLAPESEMQDCSRPLSAARLQVTVPDCDNLAAGHVRFLLSIYRYETWPPLPTRAVTAVKKLRLDCLYVKHRKNQGNVAFQLVEVLLY